MDDQNIVSLYWQRDKQAIDETQSKYSKYLYSIAYNILHNKEDSEECENDTYLSAWDSIPPNRPQRLSSFLGKITRNLSLKKYRSQHTLKRGGKNVTVPIDELYNDIAGGEIFKYDKRAEDLAEVLNSFLETLGDEERRIFICRYWYCDAVADISKQFKVGQSKVKMTLSRTRQKLREHLEKEGVYL